MPTCLECGYDLRGLELPHRCPECGRLEDSQQASEEVCAWFASKRAIWLRSSPPCFMAHLHEPRCRRIAARRLLASILLPWLMLVGVVVALNCVTIIHIYWRSPSSIHTGFPKPAPDRLSREGRAFGTHERIHDRSAWDIRHAATYVGLAKPQLDIGALVSLAFLLVLSACGVVATWVCTRLAIVMHSARAEVRLDGRAASSACGLLAGPTFILMASGIVWAILEVAGQMAGVAQVASGWDRLPYYALAAGVGGFLAGGAGAQYRIVCNCRPRRPPPVIAGLVGAVCWILVLPFLIGCPLSVIR